MPQAPSPKGNGGKWTEALERGVLRSIRESDLFHETCATHFGTLELDDTIESFVDDVCEISLFHAKEVMTSGGLLDSARVEIETYKRKLTKSNLNYMKQLALAQGNIEQDNDVMFYEPLEYLDQDVKELATAIISDKLAKFSHGCVPGFSSSSNDSPAGGNEAPNCDTISNGGIALRSAAKEDASSAQESYVGSNLQKGSFDSSNANILERLSAAEQRAAAAEVEAFDVKTQAAKTEGHLGTALDDLANIRAELKANCAALDKSLQRAAELEVTLANLSELETEMKAGAIAAEARLVELETAAADSSGSEAALMACQEQLQTAENALRSEQNAVSALHEQIQGLEEAATRNCSLNDKLLKSLQDAQAEAKELRERVPSQKSAPRTVGTQTLVNGGKLEKEGEENQRLKLMLDELQTKFKELLEECKKNGIGAQIETIAHSLGMLCISERETVFERLYSDAKKRAGRLETIRQRIRHDRELLTGQREDAEPSVISAFEQRSSSDVYLFAGRADGSSLPPVKQPAVRNTGRLVPPPSMPPPPSQHLLGQWLSPRNVGKAGEPAGATTNATTPLGNSLCTVRLVPSTSALVHCRPSPRPTQAQAYVDQFPNAYDGRRDAEGTAMPLCATRLLPTIGDKSRFPRSAYPNMTMGNSKSLPMLHKLA